MPQTYLFRKPDSAYPSTFLREDNEFGYRTLTLADPPRRLLGKSELSDTQVDEGIDHRRVTALQTPAQLLQSPPGDIGWLTLSRRSVARLFSHYLIAEDPQRRFDIRPVETLLHQVSLVNHVLQNDNLAYLLLADEVGLGKTIEVGLVLQELFAQNPALRVLYLAPARLVSNVFREFELLGLNFRQWTAQNTDARLMSDSRIIASLHRAVHGQNQDKMLDTPAWDVIIVDEAHHLSAWSPEAGDATQAYSLVRRLIRRTPEPGRVILMSGTPHQGHGDRFENLLRLLRRDEESLDRLAGRVIYRTKDDVSGWDGQPLFPSRQVNPPIVIDLGQEHRKWLKDIHDFYRPPDGDVPRSDARRRAAGWRCAQAMQWATSSPQAGLGYLARQAIRLGWTNQEQSLKEALATMRPYRLGSSNEPLDMLFARIKREVNKQQQDATEEDIEEYTNDESDEFDRVQLKQLLWQGVSLVQTAGEDKWKKIDGELLPAVGSEKVVLFAQPIETVTALAGYLERKSGIRPALIIGGQSDAERTQEIIRFGQPNGPQFLVSSRAGGEGINLQIARRLIHVDVPWNPMDMEQRVGRVHRFGSRETILVDTVVVKDSREAEAYATARQRLGFITQTLVEKDRFESVYSRVMALLPQEQFQDLLINDSGAPFSPNDRNKLAELVQRGFQNWKTFHEKYSEQYKAIRNQVAGLVTWNDVVVFAEKYAGAVRRPGYNRYGFVRGANGIQSTKSEATVVTLRDNQDYIVSDYVDALVYGAEGPLTRKLGLNTEIVADALRKHAFEYPAGPAYLKWIGQSLECPLPAGVLVFGRQTLQLGRRTGWQEIGTSLHTYLVEESKTVEVGGEQKSILLHGIFQATVATRPDEIPALADLLMRTESELAESLRRPSEEEMSHQIRYAVTPLFAGIIIA
ncbi:MAG: DEAD/DEAH box helicase [Chloroflexi bacterium]|nr:DEAD/DEAH box helicase [Chloroflexota bacterium]